MVMLDKTIVPVLSSSVVNAQCNVLYIIKSIYLAFYRSVLFYRTSLKCESGWLMRYGLRAARPRYRCSIPGRSKDFSSSNNLYWLWGLTKLLFCMYQNLYPRVKRPGLDANYSLPSSGKIRNELIIHWYQHIHITVIKSDV